MKQISVKEFEKLRHSAEHIVLDVRTPAEFSASHLESAKNYPLGSTLLESFVKENADSNKPIYVLCQGGKRAETVCNTFAGIHDNLVLVQGGMNACKSEGLATIQGEGVISLERQVRIAAGLLVLLGVIISQIVIPEAIYLSAFVGAGLIFAGITDTCGMGLMLAKMPWNNSCNTSCCTK